MEQAVVHPLECNGFRAMLLSAEQFDNYWSQIEEMLDRIPHTWEDFTKAAIIDRVYNKNLQVWGIGDDAIRMVLFTQIATYSAGPVLQVVWGAGQGRIFEVAGDAVDAGLEFFAQTQGCRRIDIIGRGGWEKVLSPRGFKRSAVVLSRRVVHRGMQ